MMNNMTTIYGLYISKSVPVAQLLKQYDFEFMDPHEVARQWFLEGSLDGIVYDSICVITGPEQGKFYLFK